jgi:5-methylcytosine-specific restriction endonuclease McrA
VYCGNGGRNTFEEWYNASLTIDHVKPIKHGGSNDDSNLVVACHACNSFKGSIDCNTLEDAKKVVAQKRSQAEKWYEKFVRVN